MIPDLEPIDKEIGWGDDGFLVVTMSGGECLLPFVSPIVDDVWDRTYPSTIAKKKSKGVSMPLDAFLSTEDSWADVEGRLPSSLPCFFY